MTLAVTLRRCDHTEAATRRNTGRACSPCQSHYAGCRLVPVFWCISLWTGGSRTDDTDAALPELFYRIPRDRAVDVDEDVLNPPTIGRGRMSLRCVPCFPTGAIDRVHDDDAGMIDVSIIVRW